MKNSSDVFGIAIQDYIQNQAQAVIKVENDVGDGYEIPLPYLFRSFQEMPEIEKKAMSSCGKRVLDVGAGAGSHIRCLQDMNKEVMGIDTSPGAIKFLQSANIKAENSNFFDFNSTEKFDSLLMMMNGIGIAESVNKLPQFFDKCRELLTPEGNLICDSADVSYLFMDDDGSILIDLNSHYYGEVKFKMEYRDVKTDWFPWLFIDFETLKFHANQSRFSCELLMEDGDSQFLAELKPL